MGNSGEQDPELEGNSTSRSSVVREARSERASGDAARDVESASDLALRLSRASVAKFWNVYDTLDWPTTLEWSAWFMPPELISLHGTEAWEGLDEDARRRLSLQEMVNFFSLTLHGERPLVQGLCNQMYSRQNAQITNYLHHFLDEENKHMVMFGEFCQRYAGKVYAQKKLPLPRKYARGEEDVTFFIKVLIVEELGDYYNVAIARDERVHPLVREINKIHHRDETRHIIFGKRVLKELFDEHFPTWPEDTLEGMRQWLVNYLRSSWADFYNPSMYRDAGVPDSYAARQAALAAPCCREHRTRVSQRLIDYFVETGILREVPAL
jgi:hypothetical protein